MLLQQYKYTGYQILMIRHNCLIHPLLYFYVHSIKLHKLSDLWYDYKPELNKNIQLTAKTVINLAEQKDFIC